MRIVINRVQMAFLWLRLFEGDSHAEIPKVAQARRRGTRMIYRRWRGSSWTGWVKMPRYAATIANMCWPPGFNIPKTWKEIE
jgi:hypothetical protein